MKKYIKPEIEICVLDIENSLLAASGPTEGENNIQTPGVDGPSALSKGHAVFNIWGDDEE
ncbi:MAG: toxin PIN [Prevotella sp.]|nr:toxin PIN [Prevotella sp.]